MIDYPGLAGHLSSTAKIVNNPVFERAVVQIAMGNIMTKGKKNSVSCLLLPIADGSTDDLESLNNGIDEDDLSYHVQKIEQRMKRSKTSNDGILKQYVNLAVLPGTSVSCEQLFSTAKFILTDTRKSTSPAVFESILLLKVNRTEWDMNSVGKAMGRTSGVSFPGNDGGRGGADASVCDADEVDDNDLFNDL